MQQGLTSTRPVGAILAYAYILGFFRLITKSAEEPKFRVHLTLHIGWSPPHFAKRSLNTLNLQLEKIEALVERS